MLIQLVWYIKYKIIVDMVIISNYNEYEIVMIILNANLCICDNYYWYNYFCIFIIMKNNNKYIDSDVNIIMKIFIVAILLWKWLIYNY